MLHNISFCCILVHKRDDKLTSKVSQILCVYAKTIDAMDPWEDLTELGYHLADLPVEPHLGKMVLCAVVLKCLDPILTITCMLSYREPFVLPAQASQKRAAMLCRRCFAANTFSDHMALLRAFQVATLTA